MEPECSVAHTEFCCLTLVPTVGVCVCAAVYVLTLLWPQAVLVSAGYLSLEALTSMCVACVCLCVQFCMGLTTHAAGSMKSLSLRGRCC